MILVVLVVEWAASAVFVLLELAGRLFLFAVFSQQSADVCHFLPHILQSPLNCFSKLFPVQDIKTASHLLACCCLIVP
jgi:hypothetical protein